MSIHHRLLAGTYQPLKLVKNIARSLRLSPADRLRVLLYHDIAPGDLDRFGAQLRWLAKSWNFVSPDLFAAMISGDEPISGRNLLVTFDDGFASNRIVAEQVLRPMGVRAIFFVVSDFAAMEDRGEARRFIADRVQPGADPDDLPEHWGNMGWTDLEALLEQGHCIGAHTRTHARLSDVTDEHELNREIVSSADTLRRRLGAPVEHFAYPFGDLASFSLEALMVAGRRFRFVHSGLRGGDEGGVSPFALRRDASAGQDRSSNYSVFSNSLLGTFLEGGADFRYTASGDQLDSWIRSVNDSSQADHIE